MYVCIDRDLADLGNREKQMLKAATCLACRKYL